MKEDEKNTNKEDEINIDNVFNKNLIEYAFDVIDNNEKRHCKGKSTFLADLTKGIIQYHFRYSYEQYILNETTLEWEPMAQFANVSDEDEEGKRIKYFTEGTIKLSAVTHVDFICYQDEPQIFYVGIFLGTESVIRYRFNEETWNEHGHKFFKKLEEICF